jgi:hypothetical protein
VLALRPDETPFIAPLPSTPPANAPHTCRLSTQLPQLPSSMASWFIRRLDRNETCYDDRRSVALRLISEGDATATSRGMSAAGPPSPPRPSAISWHCSASPS